MYRLGQCLDVAPRSASTMDHWTAVLNDRYFVGALRTTVTLATTTALLSPILFSIVAYVIVRTRWRGRAILDSLFWMSAAIPGMLAGLGLLWVFLRTPGLTVLYGTIWALMLVVVMQGKLTSTQLLKGAYLQIGSEMEEAARVSGAGWWRTYLRVWVPLIMPTMVLIGVMNFTIASGTTASIILLSSRDTVTLSILALNKMGADAGTEYEQAGIISLFMIAMTVVVAIIARVFGLGMGVRHDARARDSAGTTAGNRQLAPVEGQSS